MFVHGRELTIEWGDCDPAGIVFYPRFFAMFDAATAVLIEAASGMTRARLIRHYQVVGWPMVDTRAVFHVPVSFDDRVLIESAITRLGRSSFSIEHKLFKAGQVCVECLETRVWAKSQDGPALRAAPIPPELRAKLAG